MPQFTNLNSLVKYLEQLVPINTVEIAKGIADVLKKYVNENWYNAHSSSYDRTMDVLNSITVDKAKKIGNSWEVKIYFDESKINMMEYDGLFNAHMSIDGSTSYGNMSIAEWVVYWMNEGQDSKIYSYSGVHFLQDTIQWTESSKYHINKMKELLKKQGFTVL